MHWLRSLWYRWRAHQRLRKIVRSCGCVCYCPYGREPLNDRSEWHEIDDEGQVVYICSACHRRSGWHFGIAPIPIWLHDWIGADHPTVASKS